MGFDGPGGCTPVPLDLAVDPEDTVAACLDAAGARHVKVRDNGWQVSPINSAARSPGAERLTHRTFDTALHWRRPSKL